MNKKSSIFTSRLKFLKRSFVGLGIMALLPAGNIVSKPKTTPGAEYFSIMQEAGQCWLYQPNGELCYFIGTPSDPIRTRIGWNHGSWIYTHIT